MTSKKIKASNGREVIIETFNSFTEMVDVNDTRVSNFGYNRQIADRDFDFKTYEQAKSWLLNYDRHLETFKTAFKNADVRKNTEYNKTKNVVDVVGFQPIIPNALMSLPKSMIRTVVHSKKSKVINVLVDATYRWSTTPREVADYFSKALAYLASLEKQGFRTRVSMMFMFGQGNSSGKVHIAKILLKSELQPFDLKRMMFPLTNLGSFRLFGWDWYERLPDAEHIGGYGQAFQHWRSGQQPIFDVIGDPQTKTYMLHFGAEPRTVFEDVR